MQNWIFGLVALAIWVMATLLYMRRYIMVWIGTWLQRRAALRAAKQEQAGKQERAGKGP